MSRRKQFSRLSLMVLLGAASADPYAWAQVPAISSVVNAATLSAGPIAPGSQVVILGSNLASSTRQNTTIPLARNLGGTSVQVNAMFASLFLVSPSRIIFQMPFELANQSRASLTIAGPNGTSNAIAVDLTMFAPGIFTAPSAGFGGLGEAPGPVAHATTLTQSSDVTSHSIIYGVPVTASQPAYTGEFISVFCTGLGPVTNQPGSGETVGAGSTTRTLPTIAIGGLTVTPAFSGLAAGFVGLYKVNIQIPVNSPTGPAVPVVLSIGASRSNTVTIPIAPGPPPTLALSPRSLEFVAQPGGPAPPNQTIEISNSGRGTLIWSVDPTAGWLSISPSTGTAPSILTVVVNTTGLTAGYTSGVNIFVRTSSVSTNGLEFFSVKLIVTSSGPSFTAVSLVNGASFLTSVAAGGIASLFGTNLATSDATSSGTPLPTSLGSTTIRFNGIAAPLFYVSSRQINLQIPWELAGQTQASLTVSAGGVTAGPVTLNIPTYAPGIFQLSSGQGVILIANSNTIAAAAGSVSGRVSRPAMPGEHITIYSTGLGPVTNRPASGVPALSSPLSTTTTVPSVRIGGAPATVTFSGLVPGFVGLYQVNGQVPENAPTGSTVPVVLNIGGINSNTVTMGVAGDTGPRRAVIIDIDGLRRDSFDLAYLNGRLVNFERIIGTKYEKAFRYTNARTVFPSVTLAGQASIFTGVYPGKHGIVGNQWFDRFSNRLTNYMEILSVPPTVSCVFDTGFPGCEGGLANRHLQLPTVYDAASRSGKSSTVVFNQYWKGATTALLPSVVDQLQYVLKEVGDYDVKMMDRAVEEVLSKQLPDILAIYFAGADAVGHNLGTSGQITYLESTIDPQVGRLINAIHSRDPNWLGNTLFVITADHGRTDVISPSENQQIDNLLKDALSAVGYDSSRVQLAMNGGMAHLYLRSRLSDQPWSQYPPPADVLFAAQTLYRTASPGRFIESIVVRVDGPIAAYQVYEETEGRVQLAAIPAEIANAIQGLNSSRSGDILILLKPGFYFLGLTDLESIWGVGSSHGSIHAPDLSIPLILAGGRIAAGLYTGAASNVNVAATIAKYVGFEMPGAEPPLPGAVNRVPLARANFLVSR